MITKLSTISKTLYIPSLIHPTQQLQPPPHTVPNQKPNTNDAQLSLSNPNHSLKPSAPSRKALPLALLLTTLTSSKTLPSMNTRLIPNPAPDHTYRHLHTSSNYSLMEISHQQLPPPSKQPTSLPCPLKLHPNGIRACLHHLMGTI